MARRKKESILGSAELDMTPMIDCVFLLLIFFMITTVFKNPAQLKMVLPDALNPRKLDQKQITVELTADGTMAVMGKQVTIDQFDAYLTMEKQKSQVKSVVIRADKEAKHGEVLKLMKLAKGVAIETIAMAVEDLSLKEGSAPQ